MRITLISGMSGSGKSTALKTLEDLGYYCVDNMPPGLLPGLVEWYAGEFGDDKLAVCVDTRGGECLKDAAGVLERLGRTSAEVSVIFLDARDEVLIRRFSETRRAHPMSIGKDSTLSEALARERIALQPLRERGMVIDTSSLLAERLKDEIGRIAGLEGGRLTVCVSSFGFKRGSPIDLDFCFDVRHLPNPHWVPELRPLSGLDEGVVEFFRQSPLVMAHVDDLASFALRRVDEFAKVPRSYLSFGVGCTGGRHRSVFVAERIAERIGEVLGRPPLVRHRDVDL